MINFKNIVVFGNRLYKDGSYVNFGLYNALVELYVRENVNIVWVNLSAYKDIEKYKKNTLFFINTTKYNELINIDITNFYIILNGSDKHFRRLSRNKLFLKEYDASLITNKYKEIQPYHYINKRKRILMIPYGTLLTKNQIIKHLKNYTEINNRSDEIHFIGNYNKELLTKLNKMSKNIILKKLINIDDELDIVQASKLSCRLQLEKSKVDFRTFTHLSCGTLCITNSKTTNEFFSNKLCLITDEDNFNEKVALYKDNMSKKDIYDLMEDIINNHTFIDRINFIIKYIKDVYKLN